MGADWVATVALGNLAKIQANHENASSKSYSRLQVFWAPFLLLHLGGPDTITAYSLEDNELWSRHFLGLIVEIGVALYVFFRSFNNTALTFLFIPVFVAGIIKYGERTYELWCASNRKFKEKLLSTNSMAENAMRMVMGKKEEDFSEIVLMEETKEISEGQSLDDDEFNNSIDAAHFLFKRLEYLFANLILGFNDRIRCYDIIKKHCYDIIKKHKPYKKAFELVEIELGFMYDVLYTKAKLIQTKRGFLLRAISFFSSVSALIAFSMVIDFHVYHQTDISITFLLLAGAVFLELYAFTIFLLSDWTKLWLQKHRVPKIISSFFFHRNNKRWSESVAQHNLITFCIGDIQGNFSFVRKLPHLGKLYEEYNPHRFLSRKDLDGLMQMIFQQLEEKADKIKDNYTVKLCKEELGHRGDHVLEKYEKFNDLGWSTIDLEFDESLLLWHIATDICYHDDSDKHLPDACNLCKQRKISKQLSDYMLYLLVLCPSMLPQGIGEIRYKDTRAQLIQFLKREKSVAMKEKEVARKLLEKISKRTITQSILSDGCELARELQQETDSERKWKMISEVWVEMLTYAASHCGWREHGQQLWKGGQLLTLVSVLMAHLGLSEQYNAKEEFYLV
ncbi:uncharacterized protein LOC123205785 [Mangifera indica]|uniref:uncharacterized protein LOC123205785 n=1 Tax=Mangifera indica TaxID=29780 RepID=UPI001CFB3F57|nr:uncharacterized protein LOC123205785 [Mangifera indica]